MTTTQNRQIQLAQFGGPEVLELVSSPMPSPAKGKVLLKTIAAGVNFSDILRRRNTYFMPTPLPYVLGAEAVGEVIGLGEDVVHLTIGTRVLAILPHGGAYATHIVADAAYCIPLPPGIDAAAATAIFVQGTTAFLILHEVIQHLAGKTLLIHAAAGGVGSILVQLAKLAGATVIGTASTTDKLNFITELGADAAINYTLPDWPQAVIAANQGQKVDVVLEMVGGEVFSQSFDCLEKGGTLLVYGAASGIQGYKPSEHFVNESHQLLSFNLAWFIQHRMEQWQAALGAMIGLLADQKIHISSTHRFHFTEAAAAHAAIENRTSQGKVVLQFD